MSMLEPETIPDGALPVAELAAQMRLPDGWETVPGQERRLRGRLRAAIADVEARLGKLLILRTVSARLPVEPDRRVTVLLAPVREVLSVKDAETGAAVAVERLNPGAHEATVSLGDAVPAGAELTLSLRAGYGGWSDIPDGLAQAVLLLAEAADGGDAVSGADRVNALLAPMRSLRLGPTP
jgi:uncharacterized phiE125 gp8 family phage protein